MPHSHVFLNLNHGLKELYLATALRTFGLALVGVFIPAFLIEKGFSLTQAFLFLTLFYALYTIYAPLTSLLSHRIGIKHTAMISPFLTIAYYSFLVFVIDKFDISFYLIAAIGALGMMTYWVPMNSYFAKTSDSEHRSEETAYYDAIPQLAAIAAPLVGGIIITSFGFNWLFLIASLSILAILQPLSASLDYKAALKYPWKSFIKHTPSPHYLELFFIQGMLMISSVLVYPFYIYTLSQSFEITGIVASLTILGMAICAIIIGKTADKRNKNTLIKLGGLVSLVAFTLLLLPTTSNLFLYSLSFLIGLGHTLIAVPLFSLFCNRLDENKTEFMALRDIGLGGGRALTLILAAFAPLGFKFPIAFIAAAIASVYFILVKI
jgi:MFS family permease